VAIKGTVRIGGESGSTVWDCTAQLPAFSGRAGRPASVLITGQMFGGDGNATQFTFNIDDPIGEIPRANLTKNLASHNVVTFTEDASGTERWIGRGRIADKSIGRYIQKADDYRYFEVTVDDGNIDFRGLTLDADWSRPEESGRARLLAALAAFCNGSPRLTTTIGTHLVSSGGEVTMPAHVYAAGTDLPEILRDCATTEGKLWGAVVHHTGGSHLCMLYVGEDDHSTYACTLSLSDEDDEVDWDTVWPPSWLQGGATLESGGDNPISKLVSRWGAADESVVIATNDDITDRYDYWAVPFNDNQSETEAQATSRAASIAARRKREHVTHQPSIEYLPANKVHLIEAGMSIQIKSAASMGGHHLGTVQTRRIAQVKKEIARLPTDGEPALYHVHLQLDRPEKKINERVGSPVGPKKPTAGTPGTPGTTVHKWPFNGSRACDIHGTHEFHNGGTGTGLADGYMRNGGGQPGYIQIQANDKIPVTAGVSYVVNGSIGNWPGLGSGTVQLRGQWHEDVNSIGAPFTIGSTTGDGLNPVSGTITAPTGATTLTLWAWRTNNISIYIYLGPVTISLDDGTPGTPGTPGSGGTHPDLVGTEGNHYALFDHEHLVIRDRPPTPDDDFAAGYDRETLWFNEASGLLWVSVDHTDGAAVWQPVKTLPDGSTGSSAGTVEHDDAASVITNDSSHNAFPDAVVLPNGNVLLNYRKASGHNTTDGRLVRKLATPAADGSLSFGSEADQVPNPGSSTDIREGGLAVIGSRVWQTYRTWNGSTTHIGYIRYSDDNAATWSSPTTISGGFTTARVPFGPVVLAPDGVTLLQAVYGRNGTSGDFSSVVVRSTNDFVSQSNTTVASGTIGDGSNWTEPFLLKLDTGEVLCFIREDTDDVIYMSRCLTPNGSAWTTPAPIFSGDGKPFAFQAYSGAVILVTRQDGGDEPTIYRISYDRGETWTDEELLDDTDRHAYAAMVQLGKTLHAFFGVEFSSTNSDIYADSFTDITDARYNVGRSGGSAGGSTGTHDHDSDYAAIGHTHAAGARWEVLMTGSGASLEPVTNDAETDWLYAEVS
jgi:hypothetical protein